jgi:hypothetical protein
MITARGMYSSALAPCSSSLRGMGQGVPCIYCAINTSYRRSGGGTPRTSPKGHAAIAQHNSRAVAASRTHDSTAWMRARRTHVQPLFHEPLPHTPERFSLRVARIGSMSKLMY